MEMYPVPQAPTSHVSYKLFSVPLLDLMLCCLYYSCHHFPSPQYTHLIPRPSFHTPHATSHLFSPFSHPTLQSIFHFNYYAVPQTSHSPPQPFSLFPHSAAKHLYITISLLHKPLIPHPPLFALFPPQSTAKHLYSTILSNLFFFTILMLFHKPLIPHQTPFDRFPTIPSIHSIPLYNYSLVTQTSHSPPHPSSPFSHRTLFDRFLTIPSIHSIPLYNYSLVTQTSNCTPCLMASLSHYLAFHTFLQLFSY